MPRSSPAPNPVSLIDSNVARCRASEAEGLNVIHGNALEEETLDIANAGSARTLLAMTSNPEVNSIAAGMARDLFAIPNVHTINSTREVRPEAGSNNKEDAAAPSPLFGGPVAFQEWNRWIARREIDTTTILISQPTIVEELFKKLHDEQRMLPLLVVRDGKRLLPNTVGHLKKGDEIIALRYLEKTDTLADRFDRIIKDCPVLDIDSSLSAEEFFERVTLVLADRLKMEASLLEKMLTDREKDTSTVITRGLAIPHIIVEGKGIFNILIARCRQGVRFPGSENEVTVVFVIVGSRDERNLHLRALSAIAQIVHDPSFEEKWMDAENTEQLRQVILSAERRRF
ncbi:MAG: PTS sugar transporter subunit IIA [bacterium]